MVRSCRVFVLYITGCVLLIGCYHGACGGGGGQCYVVNACVSCRLSTQTPVVVDERLK